MRDAQDAGNPAAAQLVACECVVLAETKDHADWELLGKCAEKLCGEQRKRSRKRARKSRIKRTSTFITRKGWCRELWLDSLGLQAVLPPPEEQKHVKTAIGAALAEKESERTR